MGAIAEFFPVIDIRPTPLYAPLKSAIDNLPQSDIAVFASRNAVHYCLPLIKARWETLPSILWVSIGPGTARDLKNHGIPQVLIPDEPPFESESLLKLEALQAVEGKQITLFRGNGGRDLLPQALKNRGAKLQVVETYRRCLPIIDIVEKLESWTHNSIHVIVVTSAECLNNLILLIGSHAGWLKEIPIVVVGVRLFELAKRLKFKKPILVMDADDASIINILTELKEKIL